MTFLCGNAALAKNWASTATWSTVRTGPPLSDAVRCARSDDAELTLDLRFDAVALEPKNKCGEVNTTVPVRVAAQDDCPLLAGSLVTLGRSRPTT